MLYLDRETLKEHDGTTLPAVRLESHFDKDVGCQAAPVRHMSVSSCLLDIWILNV